jgi:hypothetical protein
MGKKSEMKDDTTDQDVYIYNFLEVHVKYCVSLMEINKKIDGIKKIRQPNFPETISEYIAKNLYSSKYNKCVKFGSSGDLVCDGKKIEVKAFTSDGPSSFGPDEKWDELIFVDAKDFKDMNFKIYKISLANNSEKWKNIKVNANETFSKQCDDGKRPRICFKQIKDILKNDVELIFDGNLTLENQKIVFNNKNKKQNEQCDKKSVKKIVKKTNSGESKNSSSKSESNSSESESNSSESESEKYKHKKFKSKK